MAIAMDQMMQSQLVELRWAPARRRVRAFVGGDVIVDSQNARLVWEPFRVVGSFAVPVEDIHPAPVKPVPVQPVTERPPILTPRDAFALHTYSGTTWSIPTPSRLLGAAGFVPDDPELHDYMLLDWAAFDEWREEDQTVISHPHDPFHRIDCLNTDRHITVTVDGVVLAESDRPTLLLETHLPPRFYLPRDDVRMELLLSSDTTTVCAYKGHASYWSAKVGNDTVSDVAWTYTDPLNDGEPIRDLVCFYDDRVDVAVDAANPPPR